jgi:hypothetical protein
MSEIPYMAPRAGIKRQSILCRRRETSFGSCSVCEDTDGEQMPFSLSTFSRCDICSLWVLDPSFGAVVCAMLRVILERCSSFQTTLFLLIRINLKTTTSRRRIAAKECINGNRGDINHTTLHDTCAHLHTHISTFTNAIA